MVKTIRELYGIETKPSSAIDALQEKVRKVGLFTGRLMPCPGFETPNLRLFSSWSPDKMPILVPESPEEMKSNYNALFTGILEPCIL